MGSGDRERPSALAGNLDRDLNSIFEGNKGDRNKGDILDILLFCCLLRPELLVVLVLVRVVGGSQKKGTQKKGTGTSGGVSWQVNVEAELGASPLFLMPRTDKKVSRSKYRPQTRCNPCSLAAIPSFVTVAAVTFAPCGARNIGLC